MSADEQHFYLAKIKRDEHDPPTLDEWAESDDGTGRFVEPIRDALKSEGRSK